MIELMNRNKKGLMGTVIIVFCSVLMVVFGLGGGLGGGGSNPSTRVIAKVAGQEITMAELDRTKRNISSSRMGRFMTPEIIEQQAIDSVVQTASISSFTESLGLTASPRAIQKEIAQIPALAQQGLSKESLENFINSSGISASFLEKEMKNFVISKQLRGVLSDLDLVTDLEAKSIFQNNQRQAKFKFIKLESKDFENKVNISDENALKAYFDENKEKYQKAESIKYNFVKFLPADFTDKVEITDEDIELEFTSMKQSGKFKVPPQVKIQQIVIKKQGADKAEELKKRTEEILLRAKNEDFTSLASEVSEDEKTKARGGERGFMAYDSLGPQLKVAALNLKQGELSQVIDANDGYYIIKLLETKEERLQELSEVKAVVESNIKNELAVEYAFAAATQAKDSWNSGSLTDFLKTRPELSKLKANISEKLLAKDEMAFSGIAGLTEAAINLSKGDKSLLEVGLSEENQTPVLVEITDKKEPYIPELLEVKEKVLQDYKQEQMLKLAKEKAKVILTEAKNASADNNTKVLATISSKENLKLQTTELSSKNEAKNEIFSALDAKNKLFSLNKNQPFLNEVLEAGDKFYIAELEEEGINKEKDFKTEKKNIISQQKNIASYRIFNALTETLKAKNDVWVEPNISPDEQTANL